jgi:hypothetical protein
MIYVFREIAGAGKNWSLGVDALSRKDATEYVRKVHHGGKFVGAFEARGKIPADCMAITSARQEQIRDNNRKFFEDEN